MKRILALSLLVACNAAFAEKPTAEQEAAIKTAVVTIKGELKDPDSARFRNFRVYKISELGTPRVCGEVNAKNSYGGYNGFTPFVAFGDSAVVAGSIEGNATVAVLCDPAVGSTVPRDLPVLEYALAE